MIYSGFKYDFDDVPIEYYLFDKGVYFPNYYTSLLVRSHSAFPPNYPCWLHYWPVYSLVNRVGDLEFHDKEASNSRSSKNIRIPNQSEIGHHFPAICLKASFEGTVFHMLQNSTTHM